MHGTDILHNTYLNQRHYSYATILAQERFPFPLKLYNPSVFPTSFALLVLLST